MAGPSAIGGINYFFRTVVYGAVVGLIGFGAWEIRGLVLRHEQELAERELRIAGLQADVAQRDRRIAEQQARIEELEARVRELELALKLLKVDHRLARLTVKSQRPAPAVKGGVETVVAFQELDAQGEALGPEQVFTLVGKVAYVDALVIKFDDSYVEHGDALRGSSICFFRRLFGEYQQPSEGFPLDSAGTRPRSYGAGDDAPAPLEGELWRRFWDYANDPAAAAGAGVRALHGEAPYMELRPGMSYRVELRASGGLTVRPD
ncbi:MAG TPA: hypothetical protein VFD43_11580 [Planctomycetota bacterium]|nr:hypothetical protein [Planctomycetota bacterium]